MARSFVSEEEIPRSALLTAYCNFENFKWKKSLVNKINSSGSSLQQEKNKLHLMITRIKKVSNGIAYIPTTYSYTRNKFKSSRQFVDGVGLQNIMRPIRHLLAKDIYDDIDMVNSEPTLLYNYCIKAGYPCNAVKYYVDNRDECFEELIKNEKIDKADAKTAVIVLVNGGKPEAYKTKWFCDLVENIKEIHKLIEKDPAYEMRLRRIKEKKSHAKKSSPIGSLISEIFQDIENACLLACLECLELNNKSIKRAVLCFDGFMIPKEEGVTDMALVKMSNFVKERTGYVVRYIKKPMDEALCIDNMTFDESKFAPKEPQIANDDDEASTILLNSMKGQILCCSNADPSKQPEVWVRTEAAHIYTTDENQIIDELISRVMALNIMKDIDVGKFTKRTNYSTNITGANNIVKTALMKVRTMKEYRNNTFVNDMIDYTKKKIFFLDGYIDSKGRRIIEDEEEDIDIKTPIRISRNVPDLSKVEDKVTEELKEKVLIPIFGSEETMTNYLRHVSRGIFGHIEDKDWLIIQGVRNCGKGVISKLNDRTFDCYYSETSANHFLMERQHTSEDPRKYDWIAQIRWARLLGTSEIKIDTDNIKNTKIDGNLMKSKMGSGGDPIEVRDIWKSAFKMIPQFRLMMMANDIPPIDPPCAVQTCSKFHCPHEFIPKDEYNELKKKKALNENTFLRDEKIKDYVKRPEVCDAYLKLVVEAYTKEKVQNCKKVKEDTNQLQTDMGDEKAIIAEFFEFTHNKKDEVTATELKEFHKKGEIKVTITKLRELLKFNGASESNHCGEERSQRGYTGVKIIKKINSDDCII